MSAKCICGAGEGGRGLHLFACPMSMMGPFPDEARAEQEVNQLVARAAEAATAPGTASERMAGHLVCGAALRLQKVGWERCELSCRRSARIGSMNGQEEDGASILLPGLDSLYLLQDREGCWHLVQEWAYA